MLNTPGSSLIPMSANPILEINDAVCRVNRKSQLRVANFAIRPGEHWTVFGVNGSGKSVLSSLLSGNRVESGNYVSYRGGFDPVKDCLLVSFEEQQNLWQRDNRLDMSEYDERAQDKGTLVEQLITSSRSPMQHDQPLLLNIVKRLQLDSLLNKGIRFLSSGQIRKVLIARALYGATSGKARLLILDDPLESIDRNARKEIETAITEVQQSKKSGGLFSTLLLCRREQDILPGTTHLALIEDLELIKQGPIADIQNGHEYLRIKAVVPRIPEHLPVTKDSSPAEHERQEKLIELRAVSASYGEQQVFSNLSWDMGTDDHVLIEGPNGCGKSTLLSLIDGENHKAYGQEVILFGRRKGSGESIWDLKSNFGVVSNELHNKYVKGWKVLDVVVSGFYDSVGLYDDSGAAEWDRARNWLTALGIDFLEKAYYHEISFGQQRLVLLARAMVKQPRILILDEPCVGLDDYHRKLILGTLDLIASQSDTRIIYVSHVSDEYPSCINSRLSFLPQREGGYRIEQVRIQPLM